jgi:glycosyltransferase involved in cell wall biosynthesis
MKILLIHQYFLEKGDGGGSRFNEMTRIWQQNGHSITVISGMVHYTTGKKYEQYKGKFIVKEKGSDGIDVFRCHVSEAYNKNFMGRLWAYFSFVLSSLLCIVRLKGHYDILLVTSPPLFVAITGILASKLKKVPFVFEVRDLWPESAIDTGVLGNKYLIRAAYWLERQAYLNACIVNALTPAFKKKLIENKQVPASKVIMIPNAADFSISDKILVSFNQTAFRKELGLDNRFIITYVGAHGVANHLQQILETAEIIKDTPACFLLIGAGMQKEWLQKETLRRSLSNVRFIDPVSKEKVFEYILASDAGTSVLKNVETFKTVYSNKTFDYMSCKKPVLMAIDGVSRELVENAQCGFYVEPENPQDFAEKIKVYLKDIELAKKHGENGYVYAKKFFDRERLALLYLDKLSTILSEPEKTSLTIQ